MASNDTNPFYDAIAEFYPLFFRDWAIQMEREGLGLRSIFRNRGVVSVLDASCGAGAQAIPLAQLGFQVTAADPSTGMLSKAREFAADYGVQDKITFLQGEFATLPQLVHGPFDAVVTKGTSLPHLLTDLEIERALQGFFTLLRPGGTLVIGMRDFAPFMEDRPRFIPGLSHEDENGYQFITFDLWDWRDGPPVPVGRRRGRHRDDVPRAHRPRVADLLLPDRARVRPRQHHGSPPQARRPPACRR